jgi:hypothetical protein
LLYLGTTAESFGEFSMKMKPDFIPKEDYDPYHVDTSHTTSEFEYPIDCLFTLQDVVEEDELRRPKMLDENGERWLLVIKNGNGTGLTIGRATGPMSFVREYFEDGTHETSMMLAIYSYGNYKSSFGNMEGAFSGPGDSGSIIVDPKGRVVGLLTGGAGKTGSTNPDVTYATPFYWLLQRIKTHFPNAHLYPAIDEAS